MDLYLKRDSHSKAFGTFGVLTAGTLKLDTVEQDWENNKPNLSCIPNGTYILTCHESPHHGTCFIMENLALHIGKDEGDTKRWGCLIHKANLASQLQGCIAVGMRRSFYKEQWSVSSSKTALGKLFEVLGDNPNTKHRLHISSNFPAFEEA